MKKMYSKPKLTRVKLDNTISLVMMTWSPGDGKPPYPPGKPDKPHHSFESPFQSPFN
jgi:hypothetical protein